MAQSKPSLTVAGLFAGIGGIEQGLHTSGFETRLLCEWWEPAQAVLRERFPNVDLAGDITELANIPDVDLVTAGFPCTDLSQAGRTKGITGEASGLVADVFRLLQAQRAPLILLENVRNMLVLDKGEAMRFLVDEIEALGYRWAYRLVDSRFTGVPQRRQRVIFLASRSIDPSSVLFADDSGEPDVSRLQNDASGFYWTEGRTGVGWAKDAVPTVKGGSTIGIASPPGVWVPDAEIGRRIVTPTIEDVEALQGFPRGWTSPADEVSGRKGTRWKLVGNAVTVGVSSWVGNRIVSPGDYDLSENELPHGSKWPTAARGHSGKVWKVDASLFPTSNQYQHLSDVIDLEQAPPLSARASKGFFSRAEKGTLNFADGFLEDVDRHARFMSDELAAVS